MVSTTTAFRLFRISSDGKPGAKTRRVAGPDTRRESATDEYDFLLCRQCRLVITSRSEKIAAGGQHTHTFANPHGIIYEIGCFKSADGSDPIGLPSCEFSWFGGFQWQIAVCRSCLAHIGWMFSKVDSDDAFFGLILDRLIYSEHS